jgi:hypothetical protein
MTNLLRQGRYADEVMALLAQEESGHKERKHKKPTGFGLSTH